MINNHGPFPESKSCGRLLGGEHCEYLLRCSFNVVVENDSGLRGVQEICQDGLASFDRHLAKVGAFELQQVESVTDRRPQDRGKSIRCKSIR